MIVSDMRYPRRLRTVSPGRSIGWEIRRQNATPQVTTTWYCLRTYERKGEPVRRFVGDNLTTISS